MLFMIAGLFVALWLLAVLMAFTLGGLVHLLLVVAIISVLIRIIRGPKD